MPNKIQLINSFNLNQLRLWWAKPLLCCALGLISLWSTQSQAAEDVDDFNAIVNQLSGTQKSAAPTRAKADMLSSTVIHGGVGFANSFSSLRTAGDQRVQARFEGVQATLGIDLLSANWAAETSARSFSDYNAPTAHIKLREFDFKIINKGWVAQQLGYRLGAGLAARYMSVGETIANPERQSKPSSPATLDVDSEYTTPSSVVSAGMDYFFTSTISSGAEINYRSTLVGDTIDRVSYDLVMRLEAHF